MNYQRINAVHLGEPGAGTFNLNCSYLGIPCIGIETFRTQKLCHPRTTVAVGDVGAAKSIAKRLRDDKEFYDSCSKETKELFEIRYSEKIFHRHMKKIWETLWEYREFYDIIKATSICMVVLIFDG